MRQPQRGDAVIAVMIVMMVAMWAWKGTGMMGMGMMGMGMMADSASPTANAASATQESTPAQSGKHIE